ncbi:hypothetical protein QUB70_28290 [Microcoleus sp. A003_D6]|uniref:hypothetical protein n=1 Tax=Microcoleus sp. A003_D6 TaxID=3055266 RepID=UPI002FCF6AD3
MGFTLHGEVETGLSQANCGFQLLSAIANSGSTGELPHTSTIKTTIADRDIPHWHEIFTGLISELYNSHGLAKARLIPI